MATALAKIDTSKRALAALKDVSEIKQYVARFTAAEDVQRAAGGTLADLNRLTEIRVRLMRRGGQLLDGMEKHRGGRPSKNQSHDATSLRDLDITKSDSSRWQLLAKLPAKMFDKAIELAKAKADKLTATAMIALARRFARTELQKGALATGEGIAQIELADCMEWLESQDPCDLLLTDPPYATDLEDVASFAAGWLPAAISKVKPTGRAYVFIGPYPKELHAYLSVGLPLRLPLKQVLVWTYRNTLGPKPSYDYKNNWQAILYFCGKKAPPLNCPLLIEQWTVHDCNAPGGFQTIRYDAWQKPDDLAARFVEHATKPGHTILDPFAGTGTFLLAAKRLGRHGFGCEHDRKMIAKAEERGVIVA